MQPADAVDLFVETALAPERWPDALESISRLLGADGASMVLGATAETSVSASHSIEPFLHDYFHSDIPDSREDRVRPRLSDGFLTDLHTYTAAELAQDPYYQEFLAPRGYAFHAVALLAQTPEHLVLSLKRRERRGHYVGADLAALERVLPYLRASAGAAAAAWRAAFKSQLSAFESIGLGAILLDRRGRVIDVNAMVPTGDGIDIRKGELSAALAQDADALTRAAGLAARCERPSECAPLPAIAIHRPSGKAPLVADVLPIAGAKRNLLAPAAAIVLLRDPARRPDVPEELLRTLFELTPREAMLASQLASGATLDEAARVLRISREHARQRLKAIFKKTQTSRQAELAALLARLR
jgi:DNA-binding CsgD family transcriptional regulator